MVENGKKTLMKWPSNHSLSHKRGSEGSERAIKRVSAAERSGARERSKRCGASEQVSGVSERVNEWPVFLAVLDRSGDSRRKGFGGSDEDGRGERASCHSLISPLTLASPVSTSCAH